MLDAMSKNPLYRISYYNDDKVFEIYARDIAESSMFGFLEVTDIVFGESSTIVVDPSEERLKMEFNGVKRTYIPTHAIVRIDEVSKEGVPKIRDSSARPLSSMGNVARFPEQKPDLD